jgi:hypothetical protein
MLMPKGQKSNLFWHDSQLDNCHSLSKGVVKLELGITACCKQHHLIQIVKLATVMQANKKNEIRNMKSLTEAFHF